MSTGNLSEKGSRLELIDRKELRINGVEDILSFDENAVYLKTALGNLNIDGAELHIHSLSVEDGTVYISGKIDGFYYLLQNDKRKNGLFGRGKS